VRDRESVCVCVRVCMCVYNVCIDQKCALQEGIYLHICAQYVSVCMCVCMCVCVYVSFFGLVNACMHLCI